MNSGNLKTWLGTLQRHGWVKGHYGSADTGYCLVGAMCRTFIPRHYIKLLDETVEEQYPDRMGFRNITSPMVSFNDHPDTTFADVEAVFGKAILRAEEQVV